MATAFNAGAKPKVKVTFEPNGYHLPFTFQASNREHRIGGHNVLIMLEGNSSGLPASWQSQILTQFGFDVRQPPATYPYTRYLEIVDCLRKELYADLSDDEAYQRLGRAASLSYFNGVSGQILKIAASVMGPVRGARQFVKTMEIALPWDKHTLVEARTGYMCYSKTFSGGSPALMLGFMQASVEAAGSTLTRLSYRVEPIAGTTLANKPASANAAFPPRNPDVGLGTVVYHEVEWV